MPPRTAAPADPERQLMIKTKTCQRLIKEVDYYKKEVKENEAKLQAMKLLEQQQQRDAHDIKKFEEVLGESYMIPDSQGRLKKAMDDLNQFIVNEQGTLDSNGEWYKTALDILNERHTTIASTTTTTTIASTDAVVETNVDDIGDDEEHF